MKELSYKHSVETRSASQIELTTKVAQILSTLNLKRVQETQDQPINKEFFFICLSGLPLFDNEFDNLDLPGQKLVMGAIGYNQVYSEKELQYLCWNVNFEDNVKAVYEAIKNKQNTKNVVFVYHSFGGFIASTFFSMYPKFKVAGIIDIGAPPIQMYPIIRYQFQYCKLFSLEQFMKNAEAFHQEYLKKWQNEWKPKSKLSNQFFSSPNKYSTILYLKYLTSPHFRQIFEKLRNIPPVLVLFCYGGKDNLFKEDFLSEKVIFYSYKRKLPSKYELELKKEFQQLYGKKVKNIQQRFVFGFQEGKHSLHLQKKLNQKIQKIIRNYISLIEKIL